MKKLLSLTLVVLFALTALVACGDSSPAELNADTILGVWTYEANAKELLGMDVAMEGSMEFKDDGTVIVSMNVEKMIKSLDLEAIAEMSGISVDEMETAMEAMGMTLDDLKETALQGAYESVKQMGTVKDGKVSMTQYYKLEGEKIYMSEDKDFDEDEASTFTYKNGELTVDGITLKK
ncbi:MAG: hypothetical protein J6M34_01200 [Clostridia bacterium]|nr:hypothetical protein [Clostridia bacterium]